MKLVIENIKFDFDRGCQLLKLKHNDCPFPNTYIAEIWNDIVPATFGEIAKYKNLEERRVGVLCLGLDRLIKEVEPKLIDTQTLDKTTSWVNSKGEFETISYTDTYKLYKVEGKYFSEGITKDWQKANDCYYVQFKDTSTDREYMLWVDVLSVYRVNNEDRWHFDISKVNAIDCIAWSIQTNIEEGNIEKIVRQGDCVMVKPLNDKKGLGSVRHLTSREYKTLLVAES